MKKLLLGAFVVLSTLTYAQKGNTTNAAMAYKHYLESLMGGNMEQAAKDILEAKDYIDKSAVHETTINDPKTLMYKGMIYIDMPMVGEAANNETIKAMDAKAIMQTGFDALKMSKEKDTKGRYEDDVDGYCKQKKAMLYNAGIKMFQDEKYNEAAAGFIGSTMFSEVLGITDSAAYFNGGLAAYNAEEWEVAEEAFAKTSEIGYRLPSSISYLAESYKAQEKFEAGELKLAELLTIHPGNKDIMVGLINLYLPQGKKDEAEKVLTDAITIDPENKELHYVVGTVYEGQERYDDAEKSYKRVLEIDPNYTDALLGLGAVYFNKAADYNNKINELQPGDPKEDEYKAAMAENFKNSLPYLIKADELNPDNKEILNSLKQAYYKLNMTEEFKATKAKIDALK